MVFSGFDDLLHMGGHGAYVWAAYGVTAAGLLAMVIWPLLQKRRLLRTVAQRAARESQREAARQQAASPQHEPGGSE